MARGHQKDGIDLPALEMRKWWDTNYHYIVPEFTEDQVFCLAANPKPVVEFKEALAFGFKTRPVIIGPVTFLNLCKASFDPLTLIDRLLPVYESLLNDLNKAGAEWIQVDETVLSTEDLSADKVKLFEKVYARLAEASGSTKLMLTNYFGSLGKNLNFVTKLPVDGLHVDLVRAP